MFWFLLAVLWLLGVFVVATVFVAVAVVAVCLWLTLWMAYLICAAAVWVVAVVGVSVEFGVPRPRNLHDQPTFRLPWFRVFRERSRARGLRQLAWLELRRQRRLDRRRGFVS